MLAETVILDVQMNAPQGSFGQARVAASFTMRNLGSVEERMDVRFPLTFWNGSSDGFGHFPEIADIQVKVDGRTVGTHRITTENPESFYPDQPVPWTAFNVVFPPGEDVQIEVSYTARGYGEYPFVAYRYILETGAGWNGTIGSADLIVRLPYEANPQNVLIGEHTGFSETSAGVEIAGRELRWHYTELEPTWEDNLEVSLVMASAWQTVLKERQALEKNPADGEAWGRLGKIYKEIILYRKGMREDPGGKELYRLSLEAYQTCLELKPDDSLWHTGYADLLWDHYYWEGKFAAPDDFSELFQVVKELERSLELNANNSRARDLLEEISYSVPDVVEWDGEQFVLLILTATPVYTPWFSPTETPTLEPPTPTATVPPATATPAALSQAPTEPPTLVPSSPPAPTTPAEQGTGIPVCGGAAAFVLPLAAVGYWRIHRRDV